MGGRRNLVDGSAPPAEGMRLGLRRTLWCLGSLAGLSAALTILFLGMRAVMDVGGTCAVGTPYQVRVECPQGVAPLVVGSIWGGLILAFIYAGSLPEGARSFVGLAWPALFLSLGWNFLDYGLDPPGPAGMGWGSLVCAVLFGALGGGPLLMWISHRGEKTEAASSDEAVHT